MEVVPFAWLVTRTVRRACEWGEGERDRRRLIELLACANAVALLRPEGALFSLIAAAVLAVFGTRTRTGGEHAARAGVVSRLLGLSALVAPVGAVLVLRAGSNRQRAAEEEGGSRKEEAAPTTSHHSSPVSKASRVRLVDGG